ncbi:MAG: sigma-70 family RNA polymerase sigma factor [Planctomycetes bacterium]|nr:sigma-70 family RNA polymerase sigma factor [Planctomycetota bacterium]
MTEPTAHLPRLLAEEPFVRALASELLAGDPDEIVQQTWLRALEATPAHLQQPRSWLLRVMRNLAHNLRRGERRRKQREQDVAAADCVPSSADLMLREEQRRQVVRAVDALPRELRAVVLLRWFEGLPPRLIAARLDVPVTTVWNRLRSALALLRERLDADHGGHRHAWALPLAASGLGIAIGGVSMSLQTKVFAAAVVLLCLLTAWAVPTFWSPPSAPGPHPQTNVATATTPAPAPDVPTAMPAGTSEREVLAPPSPVAAPAPTGELIVSVRYHDDVPASGIGVLVERGSPAPRPLSVWAETDTAGEARFTGLSPGDVRIGMPPERGAHGEATIVAGQITNAALKLEAGLTLSGIVVDAHERPIASAFLEVGAAASNSPVVTIGRSDASGRFALRACPIRCLIAARAAGFAASRFLYRYGQDGNASDLTIRLTEAGGSVAGQVVDQDGKPIVGAVIAAGSGDVRGIRSTNEGAAPAGALVRTGADGSFFAVGVPIGEQPIEAAAIGRAPWRGVVTVTAAGTTTVRIELVPGGVIEGHVHDADGKPVPDVRVVMDGGGRLSNQDQASDADGAFRFGSVPIGDVRITAWAGSRGRAEATVNVTADPVTACGLTLPRGVPLRGLVVDQAGAPVAGAWLTVRAESRGMAAWDGRAKSAMDGSFALEHGPEQSTFAVDIHGTGIAEARFDGVEFTGSVVLPVKRLGKASVTIRGIVHDRDGRPMANATVYARDDSRQDRTGHEATDMAGKFDLGPMHPGRWQVIVQGPGQPQSRTEWRELTADATWDLGIVTIEAGGAVEVVPSGDAALVAATKGRWCVFEGEQFLCGMSQLGDGRRSEPLQAGDYQLWFRAEGVAAQMVPFSIRAGADTNVPIELRPGVPQRIVLTVPSGYLGRRRGECVIRTGDRLVTVVSPLGLGREPIAADIWLAPGTYAAAATLGGLHGSATFTVDDAAGSPVSVPMR